MIRNRGIRDLATLPLACSFTPPPPYHARQLLIIPVARPRVEPLFAENAEPDVDFVVVNRRIIGIGRERFGLAKAARHCEGNANVIVLRKKLGGRGGRAVHGKLSGIRFDREVGRFR